MAEPVPFAVTFAAGAIAGISEVSSVNMLGSNGRDDE